MKLENKTGENAVLLMDSTLRDGANVVGKGFDAEMTRMILDGLLESGIRIIEMGNALGLGAYERQGAIAPLTDAEYLEAIQPYLGKAELGMFMGYQNGTAENIGMAAAHGLAFLRIGANAGEGLRAAGVVGRVKALGMQAKFAMMKAYLLTPQELAKEAAMLSACGVDEVTIMDSAGAMLPRDAAGYVAALKDSVDIPVSFHGHNNLGLSVANALAAQEAGADVLDACLFGMARSAGNIPTEMMVALLTRQRLLESIDLYKLLGFLQHRLLPIMKEKGFAPAIAPLDLALGLSGCHSSQIGVYERIASEEEVSLLELILEVDAHNRRVADKASIRKTARQIRACNGGR